MRKSGSLTSVTGDGVISIQQYSFSAAMVRNNRSHFKTNCLINSILPELFQVNITCDGRKIELCTDLFAPSGARKFWGFEEILARSSHQSEIPVPRGRGWGGVPPDLMLTYKITGFLMFGSPMPTTLILLWIHII